jgi:uncharacterized protein YndB with AHSA1/START domain
MSEPTYDLDRGFTLTRLLDAPREVVFTAWTHPAHLGWFFNPDNESSVPIELDLRVGGAWRQEMIIEEDTRYFTGGIYREITPVERLSFYFGAVGGWPELDPAHLEDAVLVTIDFRAIGTSTEMTLRVDLPDHLTEESVREWLATGMQQGWGQTIDRLVALY